MSPAAPLFDAHNHLHDSWLRPHLGRILADLAAVGVEACVVNGTCEADWADVAALAQSSDRVIPSFGLHPWDVGNRSPNWQEKLLRQLDANASAAIGEIGLDRWILDRARPDDPRLTGLRRASLEEQTDVLRWQLALAAERNLPVSIHCLDAFGALHDVLRCDPLPACGFLLHAYSGSSELAASFAKRGAYFSFNGAFLHPRKERLRRLYAQLPEDRILVETDAPAMPPPLEKSRFLLPENPDGTGLNHPATIAVAYEALAEIRGVDLQALTTRIGENFRRLFGQGPHGKNRADRR